MRGQESDRSQREREIARGGRENRSHGGFGRNSGGIWEEVRVKRDVRN